MVLGAGISGHTAAMILRDKLPKKHQVIVITPNSRWNWVPSNVWVGVGVMKPEKVVIELAPLYKKKGIEYVQAKTESIHPEGNAEHASPFVRSVGTGSNNEGESIDIEYDYLINATGPKLKFEATEGLRDNSQSICTYQHADEAAKEFKACIERMKKGEKLKFLVGTGHGSATCQGAAFEYMFNVEHELRRHKVRDMAELTWLSNEYTLGDFGMGGMHLERGGYLTSGKIFSESLYAERGISWITKAHVSKVEKNKVHYETLDGEKHEFACDFSMLIPAFSGVGLKAFDQKNEDITAKIFAPNGFMKVDADYSGKPYEQWKASDWPKIYENPDYENMFAVGIAFAPPHAISKPMKSPNGTVIFPAPPRTGMPSGIIARAVSLNIIDSIKKGKKVRTHTASMTKMGAACVASSGMSLLKGTAAAMVVFPIVPDYEKYPTYGRDMSLTSGEIGLGAHWIKFLLHVGFIYKAKGNFLWQIIPE